MERPPAQIKEFSKENAPEERGRIAGEIHAKRETYFERKKTLGDEIHTLVEQMKDRKMDGEKAAGEIEALEISLTAWKNSTVKRLLRHFQIKRQEQTIGEKQHLRDAFESEYEFMRARAEELHEQMADKRELEEAKTILKEFYREQSAAYQEDQDTRDVANITQEYEAFFVHGIHPYANVKENSLLNEWVDWKMKLKILLTLYPTIATSTIRAGENSNSLWARMGVIVSGGLVETATMQDAGTRAQGLKKRVGWGDKKNIAERVRFAIISKPQGYNEFTVGNPEIAGFYITTDEPRNLKRDLAPTQDIVPFVKALGMPLYAMQAGEIYDAEYDETNVHFVLREKVSPQEIVSRKFHLDDMQKEQMIEEILSDSPFKIKSPELGFIGSRAQGKETYVEINAPERIHEQFGEERIYKKTDREIGSLSDLAGAQVRQIAEVKEIGFKIQYLVANNRLYKREENTHSGEVFVQPLRRFEEVHFNYISLWLSTHNLGRPAQDTENYLSGMEESIESLQRKREEETRGPLPQESKSQYIPHDSWLGRLAFHLYGFGEQAEEWGDTQTKERAFTLARRIVSEDDYHGIVQKRIDEEGRFKITKEDLE